VTALPDGAFGSVSTIDTLSQKLLQLDPQRLLRFAIEDLFPGRVALVSSFGADSAVLLHMIANVDTATPVLFIDTLHLFDETLAYRDTLVAHLNLTNVRTVQPDPALLAAQDPEKFLWASSPDACCNLRKVLPLAEALKPYDAWISGRKRYQAETRATLPLFETEDNRTKINPLITWTMDDVSAYLDRHNLPRHPLVAQGYPSIGCVACTSKVKPGEDARAGRWRDQGKVECGIHLPASHASSEH